MGLKGLLLSFLGVSAITGTVIGGYYVLGPDKSNTTQGKQNNEKVVQDTTTSTQASEPAPAEVALTPGNPAEPNNIETARGAEPQTINPAKPEPGSAGTRNTGSSDSFGDGTAT